MTTTRDLLMTATGCSGLLSISVSESFSQLSAAATVDCAETTLGLSDSIDITLGYVGNSAQIFSGFVKKKEKLRPEGIVRITANDVLIRALDYFMASDDPEHPFQRNNISSLNLVRDLLAEAGITNVTTIEPTPTFTWGTNPDGARFNLQTVADAIQFIANVTGNHIFADGSGQVQFQQRRPYVVDADTPVSPAFTTVDSGNIIEIRYDTSTEKTRNVCKVYGKSPITAKVSASNPYLVVDQTVVLAHEMIDTQELADGSASVNVEILNRLGETYSIALEGHPSIRARGVHLLTESFTGASSREVFVYQAEHNISEAGYVVSCTCIP